jgi:hypothetical protein
MKISIKAFDGETPRLTDNLLNATDAQIARNCNLEKGDLRSWREADIDTVLTESSVESLNEYDGAFIVDEDDVDYVRSPIANDQYERLYFTGKDEPRVYVNDLSYPDYYKLGVPAPTLQPDTEVNSGGSGADESRIYAYTRVTAYGEEGPPCPITELPGTPYKDDDTVDITKIEAIPEDRQITILRLYRTADGTTGVSEFTFVKDYDLPTIAVFESGVSEADDGEYWSFDDGADDIIYKCINDGTTADPDDATNGVGGSGDDHWEYYTLLDDVDTSDLGTDVCPSETWLDPPAGLKGLISLSNGMFAGFVGNEVLFSVPYIPHAWPDKTVPSKYPIIGLGAFGTTTVVLTDAFPFYIIGDAPETMTPIDIQDFQPCVSKKGIVSSKAGVYYPSGEGLCRIDQDGLNVDTYERLTVDNWTAIQPAYLHGYVFAGKYFGFNTHASGTSFVFGLRTKNYTKLLGVVYAAYLSFASGKFYIVQEDPEDEILKVYEWEGDEYNYKQFLWKSKKFILPGLVNFSVAKIMLDPVFYQAVLDAAADASYLEGLNAAIIAAGETFGAIGESYIGEYPIGGDALYDVGSISITENIIFKLYVNGEEDAFYEKQISINKPFKLPARKKYRAVEVEVYGYVPIDSLEMATSMEELNEPSG